MRTTRWMRSAVAGGALLWWFGLLVTPGVALKIWWGGVIPLFPALLMIAPRLWRNVCPVAAVEVAAGTRFGLTLDARASVAWGGVGLALFGVLVAGRPAVFNGSGPGLAAAVWSAALLAVLRGRSHAVRAGFCNALCPLGGLERLYGQRPVANFAPALCPTCSACTRRGCPDIAGAKALRQLIGPSSRPWAWLLRPHGAFAAAMPGFTLAYALVPAGSSWLDTLAALVLGAGAGWTVTLALSFTTADPGRRLPPLLAAASGLAFYGLVAPASVAVWGIPALPAAVRVAGTVLVLAWALPRAGGDPSGPPQRLHRIRAGRPPGRQVSRRGGHHQEAHRHAHERERVRQGGA